MNALGRLLAFVVVLAAVFAASYGIGAAFGPDVDDPVVPQHTTDHDR